MTDSYSGRDVWALPTVITYEAVYLQPGNAHGHDRRGDMQATCTAVVNKAPKRVAHVLAGCIALAHNKYIMRLLRSFSSRFCKTWALLTQCHLGNQCASRTRCTHSGLSLWLRSTKKLEPTEWMHAVSTTYQSKSSCEDKLPTGYKPGEKRGGNHQNVDRFTGY